MPPYALRLVLSVALLMILGPASFAQTNKPINASRKPARANLSRLKIIDAHTHTDFSGELDKNRGVPITRNSTLKSGGAPAS